MHVELEIRNIVFVDDQIEPQEDLNVAIAIEYMNSHYDSQRFSEVFDDKSILSVIQQMCLSGNFELLYEDEETRSITLDCLHQLEPELFKSPLHHTVKLLKDIFTDLNIELYTSPTNVNAAQSDLIIMDYDLKGTETGLEAVKRMNFDRGKLHYIVLLTTHTELQLMGKTYNLMDINEKQEFFRAYLGQDSLRHKILVNYINKSTTADSSEFGQNIQQVLKEFYSGKLIHDAVDSLKSALTRSVEEVVGELMLLNTKTMKALIVDKLESEGASASTYLMEFCQSMIKNLVNKDMSTMSRIGEDLEKVQGWSHEIWDYETDNQLRKLRKLQLMDEAVNDRFAPIDFGDIFQISFGDKARRAILISQSCDLVVRRKQDGYGRNDDMATLVFENTSGRSQSCISTSYGESEIQWDTRDIIFLPCTILDLTSTHNNGIAKLVAQSTFTKRFSWSTAFYEYMRALVATMFDTICRSEDRLYWFNGIGYKISRESNECNFQVKRLKRLDYFHTAAILQKYTEVKHRIPLILDPSDVPYQETDVKMNKVSTQIKAYRGSKNFYLDLGKDINGLFEHLENEGYLVDKVLQNEEAAGFVTEEIKVSEQLKTRLLILSPSTEDKLSKMGIYLEFSKESQCIQMQYIHVKTLIYSTQRFKKESFSIEIRSGKLKIFVKRDVLGELIQHIPEEPGVFIRDNVDLTHDCFSRPDFQGSVVKIKLSRRKTVPATKEA